MIRRSKRAVPLAAALFTLALASGARAEEPGPRCAAPPPDAASAPSDSLVMLRPTLALLADDYERQALEYETEAARARSWASAEDMFGAAYGKRYAAVFFADEARQLETAADRSRGLAAKYRALADSAKSPGGC
jgi:hypothetical protein